MDKALDLGIRGREFEFRYGQDFLSPRNSVGGDIVMRPFVCGWVSEWVGVWVRPSVRRALPCGHDSN